MEIKEVANYRSFHKVLVKPFTPEELKAKKDGKIVAKVTVDLIELIDNDIDGLNDLVSERITGSEAGLIDISYFVAGRIPQNNTVILKVEATLSELD